MCVTPPIIVGVAAISIQHEIFTCLLNLLRVFDVNTYSKYYIPLQPHTHLSMYISPAGVDYTSIRGTRLVFSETSTRQCVDVSITDDDILEEDEDFTATLVDMPSEGIVVDPDEATIVIEDDTGAYSRTYIYMYMSDVLIDAWECVLILCPESVEQLIMYM